MHTTSYPQKGAREKGRNHSGKAEVGGLLAICREMIKPRYPEKEMCKQKSC